MSEVTKEDLKTINDSIGKVHGRIDELVKDCLTPIKVDIGVLKQQFKDHIENASLWQKPLVRTVFDLVKMAIVFFVGWFWAKKG